MGTMITQLDNYWYLMRLFPIGAVYNRYVRLSLVPDIGVDVYFPKLKIGDVFYFCDVESFPEQYSVLAKTAIAKAQAEINLYYANIAKKFMAFIGINNEQPEELMKLIPTKKINDRLYELLKQHNSLFN